MKYAITTSALALALTVPVAVAAAADLPYEGEGPLMLDPASLQWSDVASMAAPAQIALIEGDLSSQEPFIFRLKMPDGYEIRPHTHPAFEHVTVISGTLHFGEGETFSHDDTMALAPGAVAIMPPGAPMYGYTEGDTVIQLHGVGPWGIDYVNPEDDPRRQ